VGWAAQAAVPAQPKDPGPVGTVPAGLECRQVVVLDQNNEDSRSFDCLRRSCLCLPRKCPSSVHVPVVRH